MDIRIVDGRLGRDAEIKVNQQGMEFLSFTLANNSYARGKEETKWFNVLSFEPRIIALHKTHNLFVKGKAVAVTGQSDESISTRNANIYLNRTIIANRIDLMSFGTQDKQQGNAQTTAGQTPNPAPNVPTVEVPTARPVQAPQPMTAPVSAPTCEVPPMPQPVQQPAPQAPVPATAYVPQTPPTQAPVQQAVPQTPVQQAVPAAGPVPPIPPAPQMASMFGEDDLPF